MYDSFSPEQIEHFWSKVDKTPGHGPDGECWVWTAGMKTNGEYGGFYLRQVNNTVSCHKFAFLITHKFGLDDIPKEIVIRHTCNNPACVRPEHLKLGTHKHNSEDMVAAGNSLAGVKNYKATLNPTIVQEIRDKWATGDYSKVALATEYGVRASTIWQVVTNRTWRDPNYSPATFPETGNHSCKYTDSQIADIRAMRQEGMSVDEIVNKTGVSTSQVYNIINNRQRTEV